MKRTKRGSGGDMLRVQVEATDAAGNGAYVEVGLRGTDPWKVLDSPLAGAAGMVLERTGTDGPVVPVRPEMSVHQLLDALAGREENRRVVWKLKGARTKGGRATLRGGIRRAGNGSSAGRPELRGDVLEYAAEYIEAAPGEFCQETHGGRNPVPGEGRCTAAMILAAARWRGLPVPAGTLADGAGEAAAAAHLAGLTDAEAELLFAPEWPAEWFRLAGCPVRAQHGGPGDRVTPTADEAVAVLTWLASLTRIPVPEA